MPQVDQPSPDPLFILYPNGCVEASGMYVWSVAENKYIPWTGEVTVGSVTSSGVIADGVDNNILATVKDLTNSNPLAVAIVDATGDQISSFGGGTQYTEGDVDSTPTGTVAMWKNSGNVIDAVSATNPLPVSSTTLATAAKQDTGNTSLASIDTKTPALGQALAAASVPIVLTAAQITTLTPPAAITGFALEAGHLATIDTSDAATAAVAGVTTGAKVITDANGTIQQYLRGLIYQSITAGAFLVTAAISAGANLIGYVGNKRTYGGKQTITTTNFSGLTTTNAWQCAVIDTQGAEDIHFEFQTKGAAGSTLMINMYVYETLSDGTVYTDGATGTEGTFTAANRLNSRFLGAIQCNGATAVQATMKLKDVFSIIPKACGLIGINNSGGTISATGGDTVFQYERVN